MPIGNTPLLKTPFPALTHFSLIESFGAFLPCPLLTPSLAHLEIVFQAEEDLHNSKLLPHHLPALLDALPSLLQLTFTLVSDSDDIHFRLDPDASRALQSLCKERNIELVTDSLYSAFAPQRVDTFWFDVDGQLTSDEDAEFTEADAAAVKEVLDGLSERLLRPQDMVGHPMETLLGLVGPLKEFLDREKGYDEMAEWVGAMRAEGRM